jgi:hypothetical protein
MCSDLSRLRKTKLRTNENIQKIFLFLQKFGASKMKDFPSTEFDRTMLKKTLIKMEDFRIINKVRDKDGLHVYSITLDLLNEDVTLPVEDPVLIKKRLK